MSNQLAVLEKSEYRLELGEPECKQFTISVKWDGCCDIRRYNNQSTYDDGDKDPDLDYIHVCYLQELIDQLTEAKDRALAHFGKDWPL